MPTTTRSGKTYKTRRELDQEEEERQRIDLKEKKRAAEFADFDQLTQNYVNFFGDHKNVQLTFTPLETTRGRITTDAGFVRAHTKFSLWRKRPSETEIYSRLQWLQQILFVNYGMDREDTT